jgi:hypothetical protein
MILVCKNNSFLTLSRSINTPEVSEKCPCYQGLFALAEQYLREVRMEKRSLVFYCVGNFFVAHFVPNWHTT